MTDDGPRVLTSEELAAANVPGLFYDQDGNEITMLEWALSGSGADPDFRRVAYTTTLTGVRVSTVWFGINVGRSDPPLIFETMCSDSQGTVFHKWPTRAAAEAGHAELVAYYGGEAVHPADPGYHPDPVNADKGADT